eukprot:PhM_4_TR6770/c0_g1_i2/m.27467
MRDRVSEHDTALSVCVVDLDADTRVEKNNVVIAVRVGADGVLGEAQQRRDVRGGLRHRSANSRSEDTGGATHVHLHAAHACGRLQSKTSGVVHDALAHKHVLRRRVVGALVRALDQRGGLGSGLADVVQTRQVLGHELLALRHGDVEANLLAELLRDRRVGRRVQEVRGGVDEPGGQLHAARQCVERGGLLRRRRALAGHVHERQRGRGHGRTERGRLRGSAGLGREAAERTGNGGRDVHLAAGVLQCVVHRQAVLLVREGLAGGAHERCHDIGAGRGVVARGLVGHDGNGHERGLGRRRDDRVGRALLRRRLHEELDGGAGVAEGGGQLRQELLLGEGGLGADEHDVGGAVKGALCVDGRHLHVGLQGDGGLDELVLLGGEH